MAQMHPKTFRGFSETSGIGHDGLAAERRVFEWLRDAPGTENWHVVHSLMLGTHVSQSEGEADFVVAIPGRGLLLLEVKGWKAIRVHDGEWETGDRCWNRGNKKLSINDPRFQWDRAPRDPYRQARDNADSLRKRLEEISPGFRFIFVANAVVFPMGTYAPTGVSDFRWKTVDKGTICGENGMSAANALRRIFDETAARSFGKNKGGEPFDGKTAENVVSALVSEVYVSDPRVYTRECVNDQMKKWTREQSAILQVLVEDNDRIYVPSPAGTGKTLVATDAVRRMSLKHPDWTIGFFCFNDLLGEDLADSGRFQTPKGKGRIEAGSIYRLAMKIGGLPVDKFDKWSALSDERHARLLPDMRRRMEEHGIPGAADCADKDVASLFFDRLVPDLFLERARIRGPVFDYLVLDEVQDFLTRPFFDALDALLKNGFRNGRWFMCGDYENQSVQNRKSKPVLDVFSFDLRPAVCRLTVNCRNPGGISRNISDNVRPGTPYRDVLRQDEPQDAETIPAETGSPEAVSKAVVKAVDSLRHDKFDDKDILVLFQSSTTMNAWAKTLTTSDGLIGDVRLVPFTRRAKGVRYMSIRRFKGLDHPAVILVLRPEAIPPETRRASEDEQSSLLYVGMSRATFRLVIIAPPKFVRLFKTSGGRD